MTDNDHNDFDVTKDMISRFVRREVDSHIKPLNTKFNILAGVVIGTVVFWILVFGMHFINT